MARINKIGIKQTTKFFSIFYFVISLVFVLPFMLIGFLIGGQSDSVMTSTLFGGFFVILLPLIYAIMGGVMIAVFSFAYNLLAKKIGGVEIYLDENSTLTNPSHTTTPPTPHKNQ